MSDALLITPSLGSAIVTAASQARIERDALVELATLVVQVVDRIDADDATAVLRGLKMFEVQIEQARTKAKAPVLEIGRMIDELSKELVEKVKAETGRISRVLGAFELEEKRKAEAARYAAEQEARRIEQESRLKVQQARAAAPDALTADRAADAVTEKAVEQIVALKQVAAASAPTRQAGTTVREDVCFEVTDIQALYSSNPTFVTLEPNGTAIRAILRSNPILQVPGLRHWREAKLNVRT